MRNKTQDNILLLFSLGIIFSYFLSLYFDENSIGSGGYDGDLGWMWRNFEIFKSNTLIEAIVHEDFYGSRSPLLYILNLYLNPFLDNIDSYRKSIFLFFSITPIILFLTLKKKFQYQSNYILILISLIVFLSPYFRSSAVWGQEINYGILSLIITFFYFYKFNHSKSFLDLLSIIFFSSICVYFDQKLLIVPLFCFINILLNKEINVKEKIFSTTFYFILSLPFILLIFIWGGIVPSATQETNYHSFNSIQNFNLHFYNIGFASTLIALYLIPLIILKNKINLSEMKKFLHLNSLILFLPIIIYLGIYIFLDWYELLQSKQYTTTDGATYGLGFVNKLGIILFNDVIFRKLFTFLAFSISWIIIIYCIKIKATNWLIVTYFYFLSLIIHPIMQEYFDPYIFLLSLLMNKEKFNFSFNRTIMCSLFFMCALTFAIIYY